MVPYLQRTLAVALGLASISCTTAAGLSSHLSRRAQCSATLDEAQTVATRLQSYYDSSSGTYTTGGGPWTDANAVETLFNLMLATADYTWADVATTCSRCQAALSGDYSSALTGYNDDAGWFVLELYKVADYENVVGGNSAPYYDLAAWIYDFISGQWDDTCNGGVWWSTDHTYKNAITNELYLAVSARGYEITGNQTYLDNANNAWNWLLSSGMRNSDGLWNDGLDLATCENNGQNTWTYNQGVLASGLGLLYKFTQDTTYLDQAEITLDATITHLSENGVLKESCDDPASGAGNCGSDGSLFKGLWVKHVQYYLDSANDATRTAKYSPFLGTTAAGVHNNALDSANDIGTVWYAPNEGGSVFSEVATSSGLNVLVAAAKYGPCPAW
ncbi:Six-hairpin glycosidase [Stereum hirsutum FP-91666 SS1]|uniref:Six-hairpin glycosidase n=1 Tax=Stereum hirsutum (strain FP-91666) TaxID=721885 RepID=UPI000440D017|nr:Six-hairpin glycosidase [Stereum hirsutum FP-91666 SS1]EIM86953.1 Six-hairpin glycosidase [Stereum hirsutum FP-91666 SS1]